MGCRIRRNPELQELTLDQELYIIKVISRFNIDREVETPWVHGFHLPGEDSKLPAGEDCYYRAAVGALIWASVLTRPDISNAVREVAPLV
ncbi:unnamed protein product, partial [Discosporangium mesarthrocarpum]